MAFTLLLPLRVSGQECELTSEGTDPSQVGVYIGGQSLQASPQPGEKLSATPKYRSQNPIDLLAELGLDADKSYTLILDEWNGTGKGYVTVAWIPIIEKIESITNLAAKPFGTKSVPTSLTFPGKEHE